MEGRHGYSSRYSRPRSPIMSNPGRNSLPNVGYSGYFGGGYDTHVYPAREFSTQPRSSTTVPTTTTKYRVVPNSSGDIHRTSSLRAGSRTRSATVDASGRSLAVSPVPRLGPVIHHPRVAVARPASPISNPYRASDEGAYLVPASSHHHQRAHHRNGYSIDNGSEYRAKNREWINREGRESAAYAGSRGRPSHSGALVTASDDYLDTGYSYTNPREVVKYELDHTTPRQSKHRRDSDTRARPASITGIADIGAKSYDARERGPPPATRGRDKIPTRATFEVPTRSRAELAYESDSRSRKSRPVSMYQEREAPRIPRDTVYSTRETEMRERASREKSHHQSRHDDSDRLYNNEKHGHGDRKEHKSRDSLAATFAAAAGALGLGAVVGSKDNKDKDNDRDERDEPPRRPRDDSDEERRRRRREEAEPAPIDLGSRNPREKSYAGEGRRESPPIERESLPNRDGEYKRDSKDKRGSISQSPPRDKRSSPPTPREEKSRNRSRSRSNSDSNHSSELSMSDRERRSRRERERSRTEPTTPTTPSAAFNPKDTMDLRALKAQLNRQDEPRESKRSAAAAVAVGAVAAGAAAAALSSRGDRNYDSREDDRGRRDLIDETSPPNELRDPQHIRVVSPPRETQIAKTEEKPVKGILRAPRDKFPEDPTHIREGVAPLKDAKKDGVPPDARWTKISRSMVNPAALEAGKERFEEQEDHVIVLRVLSKDEIQAYATITESIRAAREEEEHDRQRRRRRERHERHKRERAEHHRSSRRRKEEDSESDTTEEDDRENDHVRAIEAPDAPRPKRIAFEDNTMMSGGLGDLRENPNAPGTYTGYSRNPPPLQPVPR